MHPFPPALDTLLADAIQSASHSPTPLDHPALHTAVAALHQHLDATGTVGRDGAIVVLSLPQGRLACLSAPAHAALTQAADSQRTPFAATAVSRPGLGPVFLARLDDIQALLSLA